MKFSNGRQIAPGLLVVGVDVGGNLVSGQVMALMLRSDDLRLLGVPLPVPATKCLLVEDAYSLAMQMPEAERQILKLMGELKTAQAAAADLQSELNSVALELSKARAPNVTEPAAATTSAQATEAAPEPIAESQAEPAPAEAGTTRAQSQAEPPVAETPAEMPAVPGGA